MPGSARQAVSLCIEKTLGSSCLGFDCNASYCHSVAEAVAAVLACGRAALVCALEDARKCVRCAAKAASREERERGGGEGQSQGGTSSHHASLKLGAKKVHFMQSWVLAQHPALFDGVAGELRLVLTTAPEHSQATQDDNTPRLPHQLDLSGLT